MEVTPVTATWVAITAPFLARWAIAGFVWGRVHGLTFTPNVNPRVETTDFPPPNRAAREFGLYLAANVAAVPLALVVGSTIGPLVPLVAWQAVEALAIGAAVIWVFRRLRADDRRWIQLKRERIAAERRQAPHVTFTDAD